MHIGAALAILLLQTSVSYVESQQPTCGGAFYGAAVITSPGYPGYYPPGKVLCRWTVTAALNRVVVLQFASLDLPPNNAMIRVFVGSRLITSYTGNVLPPPLTLDVTAVVEFTSNRTAIGVGFKLVFISRALKCGGYTAALGTVRSPGYPTFYPSYASCYWTVIADPGRNVELTITAFDVEGGNNDKLKIYDEGRTLQGTYSGNLSTPFKLQLGSMAVLEFTSNNAIQGIGFNADVRAYTPS